MVILLALLLAAPTPIIQCVDASGRPFFTDRDCPADATTASAVSLSRGSNVQVPKLSDAEKRALKHIGRTPKPKRRAQVRPSAAELCALAKSELRALREQRRRGYSVRSANALEEQEQKLKRARRAYCR